MTNFTKRLALDWRAAVLLMGAIAFFAGPALAIQPDAPFIELAKKNHQEWMAEDQQVNAKLAALHKRFGKRPNIKQLLATLKETGIEQNTLLVWVSDNGPMQYFWPNGGYSWLRGHKGDVLEGGVRTPCIAYWPGMIKSGQKVIDMTHVVDLLPTAARISGATRHVPNDRVTDPPVDGHDRLPAESPVALGLGQAAYESCTVDPILVQKMANCATWRSAELAENDATSVD